MNTETIRNLFLICASFCILYSCSNCEKKLSFSIDDLEFNGIVEEKYIDSANHLYPVIIINDNSKEIYFIAYERFSGKELFDFINPGDSVFKENLSREFKVIKQDSLYFFTFKCNDY